MCVEHIGSPQDNARNKVEHIYTGDIDTELADAMFACDPDVSCTPHPHSPPNPTPPLSHSFIGCLVNVSIFEHQNLFI